MMSWIFWICAFICLAVATANADEKSKHTMHLQIAFAAFWIAAAFFVK